MWNLGLTGKRADFIGLFGRVKMVASKVLRLAVVCSHQQVIKAVSSAWGACPIIFLDSPGFWYICIVIY